MTTFAQTIRQQLELPDPFDKFPANQFPPTLKGAIREAEFMQQVLEIANPRLIIEVGSWKGDSAALIASHFAKKGIDGALVCVDTWLGGIEHIGSDDPYWGLKKFSKNGYPTLYYNFLANMMHADLQRFVIPIPNTSVIAARYLQGKKIVADLIYIDASHDEDDVYADLQAYWPILRQGGGAARGRLEQTMVRRHLRHEQVCKRKGSHAPGGGRQMAHAKTLNQNSIRP